MFFFSKKNGNNIYVIKLKQRAARDWSKSNFIFKNEVKYHPKLQSKSTQKLS